MVTTRGDASLNAGSIQILDPAEDDRGVIDCINLNAQEASRELGDCMSFNTSSQLWSKAYLSRQALECASSVSG